jgi:PAS domain S-box-containing protein
VSDTARAVRDVAELRREAVLEAVAFAAERLLLGPDWDDAVRDVLARLGRAADASRAYLFENVLDDQRRLATTRYREWGAEGIVPLHQDGDGPIPWVESGFGRWATSMRAGAAIHGLVSSFPPGEQTRLREKGIRALLCFPITVGEEWWGYVGFDECREDRGWTADERNALRTAASILSAAIGRRRADEQLREAQERSRQLVELIPAITYTDIPVEGGVRMGFVSPQIGDILGYPPERFIADPGLWVSLIHHEDLARLRAANAFDINDLAPFDHEYRMLAADGREVWLHDTSTAILGDDGGVAYFLGFAIDITKRKRAEERLRLTEERYRAIVEQTPAISYQEGYDGGAYGPDNAIAWVSPQIERILGYTPDEWVQPGFWLSVVHPDDREAVLAEGASTSASQEIYRQDYRMIARDGRIVWFHDESVLIRDDSGRPVHWQGVMLDITERKRAEQQLSQAEERYRQIVERTPAIVYQEVSSAAPDGSGSIVYVSPQFERILGYPADTWNLPGGWVAMMHPEDRDRVLSAGEHTKLAGETWRDEYRMIAADGRVVWFADESVPIRDDQGEIVLWQGVMLDITDQKQVEERLRSAEGRYRALIEHIPAVVYRESPEGDPAKFYISPQVLDVFGYTADEWTWTPAFWRDRIHPEDRETVYAIDDHSNMTFEGYSIDYRFLHKDGHWIWVRDEATFVPEPHGEGFWQGFLLDITERKDAEQQLREAEQKFRTIVEQNQAIFYMQEIDPSDPTVSKTTYIAPGNTQLIGYSVEEVQADPTMWRRIVHPDDRERVFSADADSNTGGSDHFSLEYRMIRKDGRIVWVQDEARLVKVGDKPPFWQGFLLDITERKAAEEQMAHALQVEREAGRRLRALDDMKNTFLQAVSHDLRTPLAAILGLAITLERGDVHLSEDDARDLAGRIAGNARKLDRLVVNLLDMDRLARGIVTPKLEPTDVGSLARMVVAETDIPLQGRVHIDVRRVVVPVDGSKLERILENLLANTVRHTPSNASIWIRVRQVDDGALLCVDDDGPGVPEELRETIFEPFRQGPDAPQHAPGVGVGLTLVRRFAELHGGRAWVEPREGGGSSFRVWLPTEPPPDLTPGPTRDGNGGSDADAPELPDVGADEA